MIIRSREGVEFHSCEISKFATWRRTLTFKEPSLEKILEEMGCFVPCSYLKICDDPNLPHSFLDSEKDLISACQIGIFTQSNGDGYDSFLRWIFDVEPRSVISPNFDFDWKDYRFQFRKSLDAPILIVFQDEMDEFQDKTVIENISSQMIVVISREHEIDGFGIDVAVRSNLLDLINIELPSPAIFGKSATSREFVLRLLLHGFSALSNSVYYPQLKNRRHTALYDLCKHFLIKN